MSDLHNPASQSAKDPVQDTQICSDDRSHVFHSWSVQGHISPLPITGGQGAVTSI